MEYNEIDAGAQEETPKDEMDHSSKFLEQALKMKKEKKVSAKVGGKKRQHKSGVGKSFGKSSGK